MAAASSSQLSLQPPLVQRKTQQTTLTHVEVEVREGMSGQPDGGAGAEPLLPALPHLHRHRHHPHPLPPGSTTHSRFIRNPVGQSETFLGKGVLPSAVLTVV